MISAEGEARTGVREEGRRGWEGKSTICLEREGKMREDERAKIIQSF